MSLNRKIVRQSVIISLIGFVGQVLNFFLTLLIAHKFGSTKSADAFFLASAISVTGISIVGGIIKIIFIPLFVEEKLKHPETYSSLIGQAFMMVMSGAFMAVGAIYLLAHSDLISLSPDIESRRFATEMVMPLAWTIPLVLAGMVFTAVLNAQQTFGIPEVLQILKTITMTGFLYFGALHWGAHTLVWGSITGQVLVSIGLTWLFFRKFGQSIDWRNACKRDFRPLFRMSGYPLLAYLMVQFQPITSNYVGSMLDEGSVAIINYSQKIAVVPVFLLGTGFTSVILSYWSKSVVEKNKSQISNSLNHMMSCAFTFLTPLIVALYFLREPVITILFRQALPNPAILMATANVMAFFLMATIPMYIQMIVVRVLIAENDLVWLFLLTLPGVFVHPAMAYGLAVVADWGPSGIALSHFVTTCIVAIGTIIVAHKRHVRLDLVRIGRGIVKVILGIIPLAGITSFWAVSISPDRGHLELIFLVTCATVTGFLGYFAALWISRHQDIRLLAGWAHEFISNHIRIAKIGDSTSGSPREKES